MGQDSKHQKVGRVGARELEELGTEDGMGDLGSGVGTEGVTGVRQSWDRRVRTRSWDRGCDRIPPKMRRESWDRRVGTRSWDQRVGTGGCVGSLLEVGPESSDRRVGTQELGPGVGTRGLGPGVPGGSVGGGAREFGPENWDQRVQSREL